jgi:hypothetical protein
MGLDTKAHYLTDLMVGVGLPEWKQLRIPIP